MQFLRYEPFYPRQQPHLALRQWAMAIVVVIWCPRLCADRTESFNTATGQSINADFSMQEQRLTNADGDVDAEIEGGENVLLHLSYLLVLLRKNRLSRPRGQKTLDDASRGYFFLYRESATDFVVVAAITTSITSWLSRTAPSTTTTGIGKTPQQSTSAQTTYAPHGGSSRSRPPPGVPILKSVSTGSKPNPNFRGPPPGVKVLSPPSTRKFA